MDDQKKMQCDLAIAHLEQLKTRKLKLSRSKPKKQEFPLDDSEYLNTLETYNADNKASINAALESGVWTRGTKSIDWNKVFFGFMESCATYLRDEDTLEKAVNTYRDATQGDEVDDNLRSQALKLYLASTEKIRCLASQWKLGYCMLTDLWTDENDEFESPYCGAFYSLPGAAQPFIGIAFKGTLFTDLGQDEIDDNYEPMQAPAGRLFNSWVSTGVYNSLFNTYGCQMPYDVIRNFVCNQTQYLISNGASTVATHVTGHSLGASYSCFAYAQLLIDKAAAQPQLQSVQIGDLYNFACPRVGLTDWATAFTKAASENTLGATFRIVNSSCILGDDFITLIPPTPKILSFCYEGPWFNHIDTGYRIDADANPVQIATEVGTEPGPPGALTALAAQNHETSAYYASLQNALCNNNCTTCSCTE